MGGYLVVMEVDTR